MSRKRVKMPAPYLHPLAAQLIEENAATIGKSVSEVMACALETYAASLDVACSADRVNPKEFRRILRDHPGVPVA